MNSDAYYDAKNEIQIKSILDSILGDDEDNLNTFSLSDKPTDYTSEEFYRRDKRALTTNDKKKNEIITEIDQSNYTIFLPVIDNYSTNHKRSSESKQNLNNLSTFNNQQLLYQDFRNNISIKASDYNLNNNSNSNFNVVVTPCETLNFNHRNKFYINKNNISYLSPNLSLNSSLVNSSGSASPDSGGQTRYHSKQDNEANMNKFLLGKMNFNNDLLNVQNKSLNNSYSR